VTKTALRAGIIGLGPIAIRRRPAEDVPAAIQKAMEAAECGRFTPFGDPVFASHALAISQIPEIEVAAVSDLSQTRRERFRDNWGAIWPDAGRFDDYREMLAAGAFDIVVVATPEHLHAEPVVAAAEAGARAIFCEKPLATSLADADRMIAACNASGALLTVDYTRRWTPLFHTVRNTVRSGAIGDLSTISVANGGSQAWLFRSGSHLLDAMVFFAGTTPVKCWAHLEDGFGDWDVYRGSGGGNTTERDPGASGYVLFGNGVRASYSYVKTTAESFREVAITGTRGYISFRLDGQSAQLCATDPDDAYGTVEKTLVPGQVRHSGIEAAYCEIVDNLAGGGESISSASEARKSVQIMMGFLESHQRGGQLIDVPD